MFIRELLALYVYNYFEMINPTCSFFSKLSPKFCDEPMKRGHFQDSESIFEVKYLLNLPENDFLLRIVN